MRACVSVASMLLAAACCLAVEVGERSVEGRRYLLLKSETLEALVSPERGGQIVSLLHLGTGAQVGNAGSLDNGLFSDHDLKQPHPGELMGAPYEAQVLPPGADGSTTVRLSYLAQGGWRDETAPSLKDMLYEKWYTLLPRAPVLRCRVKVTNQSQEDKLVDYWSQCIAHVGPGAGRNYYFRPAPTGLSVISSDDFTAQAQFVTEPTAGWSAAVNRRVRLGLVYLVDYNYLDRLYNCNTAFTQEFMYERVPLPPGKSWETSMQVRVVEGFDSVTHASERLVADTQVTQDVESLQVTHRLCAWDRPLANVRLATALREVATQTEKVGPEIALPQLGLDTVTETVEFDATAGGMKILMVTVFSEAGVDRYELPLFPFGDVTGAYRRPRPPRQVVLPQPDDLAAVWKAARAAPRGLLQLGDAPYADQWRLQEIAGALGLPYAVAKYTPAANWRDASLHPFPLSHADLFAYEVVVLADGDAKALRRYGCEMLKDYVAQGGGVLFLGGYNSLGKGALPGTPLGDLLPVATQGLWDLRPAAVPAPQVTTQALPFVAEALRGVQVRIDWFQEVTAKPGATTSLTLDGHPLLVTQTYGRGRVAVLAATPLLRSLAPGTDQVPLLVASPAYVPLMKALLRWLQAQP